MRSDQLLAPLRYASGAYDRAWRASFGLVLCYHRSAQEAAEDHGRFGVERGVSVSDLQKHLEFVVRRFRPATLEQAGEGGLTATLTFDDGYRDTLAVAAPLLRRYGMPGAVFVCPDYVGTTRRFWWERLGDILRAAPAGTHQTPLGEVTIGERRASEFERLSLRFIDSDPRRVDDLIAEFSRSLGVRIPDRDGRTDPFPTWSELRALADSGWTIGAHGMGHHNHALLRGSDLAGEIADSVAVCERQLGRAVTSYALPYGRGDDQARRLVAATGVAWCMVGGKGVVVPGGDRLATSRVQLNRPWPFAWACQIEHARRLSLSALSARGAA